MKYENKINKAIESLKRIKLTNGEKDSILRSIIYKTMHNDNKTLVETKIEIPNKELGSLSI